MDDKLLIETLKDIMNECRTLRDSMIENETTYLITLAGAAIVVCQRLKDRLELELGVAPTVKETILDYKDKQVAQEEEDAREDHSLEHITRQTHLNHPIDGYTLA